MTGEARALFEKEYPGANPNEPLSRFGVCEECRELPASERKTAADRATKRILAEMRLGMLAHAGGAQKKADGSQAVRN